MRYKFVRRYSRAIGERTLVQLRDCKLLNEQIIVDISSVFTIIRTKISLIYIYIYRMKLCRYNFRISSIENYIYTMLESLDFHRHYYHGYYHRYVDGWNQDFSFFFYRLRTREFNKFSEYRSIFLP